MVTKIDASQNESLSFSHFAVPIRQNIITFCGNFLTSLSCAKLCHGTSWITLAAKSLLPWYSHTKNPTGTRDWRICDLRFVPCAIDKLIFHTIFGHRGGNSFVRSATVKYTLYTYGTLKICCTPRYMCLRGSIYPRVIDYV